MGRLAAIRWLFSSQQGASDRLIARWIVLRALGLIYFSAFFSLVLQIRGLIGPHGILPASEYLQAVARSLGPFSRLWFAPTLLWLASGSHMLLAICWAGMAAALLVALNLWPRAALAVCFVCFLSFVSAAQDFSGYQSDGMLLEAGFLALFFAPGGLRPGLGRTSPPSRASLFLLQWEWFRIYFESGLVKLLSGDQEWRHLTAMDEYYQNGPLPTWVGWYVQHLPHWFHVSTAFATLALELGIVWMLFLPRRWRILCFLIVTPWELGVIFTANYTFLNYLVLTLGFLLLDDTFFLRWLPWIKHRLSPAAAPSEEEAPVRTEDAPSMPISGVRRRLSAAGTAISAILLTWAFYATTAELVRMAIRGFPLPAEPIMALEPFRIANQYGLFAVMTHGRYEIEFQGTRDGRNWTTYPFRFKPQELNKAPGIYAPYQPRFEWNLWFASLGPWQQNLLVPRTEERLLENDPQVLALFASNPFPGSPPIEVRAVLWQYWFTTLQQKRETGNWWRRVLVGIYAPVLGREENGRIGVVFMPEELPPHD
ncbi:MAG TPA: lipase maturation factor family protein [Acidobacteriaceae bacterium]|nr:lipase maturation factor family protein [Acidobacteriaceae bacterium]